MNREEPETVPERRLARWVFKNLIAIVLFGGVVLGCAGTLRWPMGWAFIGTLIVSFGFQVMVLLPRNPDLLVERSSVGSGTKRWDLALAPLVAFSPLLIGIVSSLNHRFGWSDAFPLGVSFAGLALALLGIGFTLWAMTVNTFFAPTVRIQEDRGHHVIDTGPYRIVRHPGYLGAVAYDVGLVAMLDSLWALIPLGVALLALIVRTGLEDRTLQRELPGYAEYACRVRHRLLPLIW